MEIAISVRIQKSLIRTQEGVFPFVIAHKFWWMEGASVPLVKCGETVLLGVCRIVGPMRFGIIVSTNVNVCQGSIKLTEFAEGVPLV